MVEIVLGCVQVAGQLNGVATILEDVLLLYLELRELIERRNSSRPIAKSLPAAAGNT
jgi:hypothetical protein